MTTLFDTLAVISVFQNQLVSRTRSRPGELQDGERVRTLVGVAKPKR